MAGSAAQKAGLKANDRILSINKKEIKRFEEIIEQVQKGNGKPVTLKIKRNQKILTKSLTPKMIDGRPILGIQAAHKIENLKRLDPYTACVEATTQTYEITIQTLNALKQMITGDRSSKELGGILRIAEFSGDALNAGIASFIIFMGLLSINLGIINLFPIVPLDGGHLLFYGIEAIKGRPLTEKTQERLFKLGLAFVIFLMIYATWNDIMRLIGQMTQ